MHDGEYLGFPEVRGFSLHVIFEESLNPLIARQKIARWSGSAEDVNPPFQQGRVYTFIVRSSSLL